MKKLLSLVLLLLVIAVTGCFNQEKDKQEEKEVIVEKAGTKSDSGGVSSYYKVYFEDKIIKLYLSDGFSVTATKDSVLKLKQVWTYNPQYDSYYDLYSEKPQYSEHEAAEFSDSFNLKKGKEYYIYCNYAGWYFVTEVGTVNIINEKNQVFKTTISNEGKWHAEGVSGNYFRIVNIYSGAEYTLTNSSDNGIEYGLSTWSDENIKFDSNKSYAVDITPDFLFVNMKEEEKYKVICDLGGLDIGYANFYPGMNVQIVSEDKKVITTEVIHNYKTNSYYIEVDEMKPGTYIFKSTYQREQWDLFMGKQLIEYSINSSVKISKDSGFVFYDTFTGKNILKSYVAVNKKVIRNLSKIFNSLAICGDFNKWNVKGNMVFKGNYVWEGDIETSVLNTKVLFVSDDRWGNNYGDSNKDGIAEKGNGYINLQFAGKYHIIFNDETMKYSIELTKKTDIGKNFNEIAVSGTFNGWSTKGNMIFLGTHKWQYKIDIKADSSMVFVMNNSWGQNYGDKNKDGIAEKGNNYIIVKKGVYQILFDDETLKYTIKKIN